MFELEIYTADYSWTRFTFADYGRMTEFIDKFASHYAPNLDNTVIKHYKTPIFRFKWVDADGE